MELTRKIEKVANTLNIGITDVGYHFQISKGNSICCLIHKDKYNEEQFAEVIELVSETFGVGFEDGKNAKIYEIRKALRL